MGISHAGFAGVGPAETGCAKTLPRVEKPRRRSGNGRGLAAAAGVARPAATDRWVPRLAAGRDERISSNRERVEQTGGTLRRRRAPQAARTLPRSGLPDRPPRATGARARRVTRRPRLIWCPATAGGVVRRPAGRAIASASGPVFSAARLVAC